MLSFTLHYGGCLLNNIWRPAAENAVKLCPKNAALETSLLYGNVLYDSYPFPNVTVGKTLRVDVCYPEDDYPQKVCVIRFTILDGTSDNDDVKVGQNKEEPAERYTLPREQLREILHFLERFDIEVCQLTCRRLSEAIASFSLALPLHCISMALDSSSYENDEPVQCDIFVKPCEPDGYKCGYFPRVHPCLPEGHYVRCSNIYGCNVMKATVGGTVKLMRREDPHVCSTHLGPPYDMVTRIVRYANAIGQDESDRLHELLRLTANSVAASIFFSWTEGREFVATSAFIATWRKALETKDGRRMRLQVHDWTFSYCSITALTPKHFVDFFCDELEILDIAPLIDAAQYDKFFEFDSSSRDRWNAFRKRNN